MPESKNIIIDSIYSKRADEAVTTLLIQPANILKNTLMSVLNLEASSHFYNNKEVRSGDLCMVMKNHKTDIDFTISEMGELIVSGEDSKNYSINDQGELIYTFR